MEEIDFKKEIEAMKYFANKNAVSVFDIVHKECRVKEEDLRREGIMADMLNQEIQELQKDVKIEICENCKKQNNCNHKELIHRDDCRVNDCDYYCEVMSQENQIEEMDEDLTRAVEYDIENSDLIDSCATAIKLIKLGWIKPNKDSVVLSKEEYEKLKKYEYKVQCGVCFTQKEWFDFINEDSNFRTSLQIKAEEKGYEQAHKEMLKDCIESNKIAEQIGYEKGSKEMVEKIIKMIKQTAIPVAVGKHTNIKFIETSEEELNAIAKQCGVEIKE